MKKAISSLPFFLLFLCLSLLLFSCDKGCLHLNESIEVIPPSCDKEGYTLHICHDCLTQYRTDYVIPAGHIITESAKDPSCTEPGYTEYACACGYVYKGSFCEPVGHTYVPTVTPPTCEVEGYTTYSCACGYSYIGNYTAPSGHVYLSNTTHPTCEAEGYTEYTCTVCQYAYRSLILSALGHSYTPSVTSPTCTDQGYTEYTCQRGDSVYRSDFVAPLGHQMTVTHAVHPTLLESGQLTHQCLGCDYRFTNQLLYNDVFANAYTRNSAVLAKGVDISYHNHTPDSTSPTGYAPLSWNVIRNAGFDFAILRAGYSGFVDPVFEMNYTDAKAAGMDLGVYYYAYAKTPAEAKAEAEELIGLLAGKQFEYPVYYDLEDPSLTELDKDRLTEICMIFISTLRDAGYYGALYSNNNWLTNHLNAEELKSFCELWYARYQKDPTASSELFDSFLVSPEDTDFVWLEKYGKQVGMWQYTQCGIIEGSGIKEKVDFNYTYKDYPSLMKAFRLNGYLPPA